MHIIDVAVRRFLQSPSTKQKVVVNLGCGSDVLPWQCLTRYPDHCQGVKFVDVDFPDLMRKKCRVVQETPELLALLSGVGSTTGQGHLVFQSDQYVQIGCDLRDLSSIEQSLSTLLSLPDSEFLFVAEVSITYMETEAADSVIKWASSLGHGMSLYTCIANDVEQHLLTDLQPSSACWSRSFLTGQTTRLHRLCCAISRN